MTTTPSNSKAAATIARTVDVQGEDNFVQGCEFSPDGLCVLTSSYLDNVLRIYNTPPITTLTNELEIINTPVNNGIPWKAALTAPVGDSIRAYTWYPFMNSLDPITCTLLCTVRDQPVYLIDAYTAGIRATYRPYNALDEMESPSVVTFTPDGRRIFAAGFKSDRTIHVFDTNIPGRDSDILRLGKTRRSDDGQKGLISALAFPPCEDRGIFAVGTYSPGSIYIYDHRTCQEANPVGTVMHGGLCVVGHGKSFARKKRRFDQSILEQTPTLVPQEITDSPDHEPFNDAMFAKAKVSWFQSRTRTGVTQLTWANPSSNSEFLLYSSSRRSDSVLAWDLRMLTGNPSHPIQGILAFPRNGETTNQKLQFDLHTNPHTQEEELITASQDQGVLIYSAQTGQLRHTVDGFDDVVNGVSTVTKNHTSLLAVAVGGRRFPNHFLLEEEKEKEEDDDESSHVSPGYLELYNLSQLTALRNTKY